MKLFCLEVGGATAAFPVDIDRATTIGDLKRAIKRATRSGVEEKNIALYLAQDDSGRWLDSKGPEVVTLMAGSMIDAEHVLEEIDPTESLREVFSDLPPRTVHVLFKLRTPTSRDSKWQEELLSMHREYGQLKRQAEESRMLTERYERAPSSRKHSWGILNEALCKKPRLGDYTAFADVDVDDVPDEFKPRVVTSGSFSELMLNAPMIDGAVLDSLVNTIEMKMNIYDQIHSGHGATVARFTSAILEHVAFIFDDEDDDRRVRIGVNVERRGLFVEASGVVDFLLTRGKRNVCVIIADDMGISKGKVQGMLASGDHM